MKNKFSIEMMAVVNIAGQQFKVTEGQEIFVHHLNANPDDKISFDEVLLISDPNGAQIGTPDIKGASIEATILEHQKGDKVIVFKKKRRKGYQVKNGHRQSFTKVRVDKITV